MSCKMAGINGTQEKKKEEDKRKKEKYHWTIESINRVKNNDNGVPRITILNWREKLWILFFWLYKFFWWWNY